MDKHECFMLQNVYLLLGFGRTKSEPIHLHSMSYAAVCASAHELTIHSYIINTTIQFKSKKAYS